MKNKILWMLLTVVNVSLFSQTNNYFTGKISSTTSDIVYSSEEELVEILSAFNFDENIEPNIHRYYTKNMVISFPIEKGKQQKAISCHSDSLDFELNRSGFTNYFGVPTDIEYSCDNRNTGIVRFICGIESELFRIEYCGESYNDRTVYYYFLAKKECTNPKYSQQAKKIRYHPMNRLVVGFLGGANVFDKINYFNYVVNIDTTIQEVRQIEGDFSKEVKGVLGKLAGNPATQTAPKLPSSKIK